MNSEEIKSDNIPLDEDVNPDDVTIDEEGLTGSPQEALFVIAEAIGYLRSIPWQLIGRNYPHTLAERLDWARETLSDALTQEAS